MFKVRVIGLLAALGLILTVAGIIGINKVEEETKERALARVANTRPALLHALETRKVQQAFLVALLAKSELAAAMAAMEEIELDLEKVWADAYAKFPGTSAEAVSAREGIIKKVEKFGKTLPEYFAWRYAEHTKDIVGEEAFTYRNRETFLREEADRLTKCAAFGGVDQCMWDFTYNTLPYVFARIARTYKIPAEQSVYVVDARGIGRADFNNPQWSRDVEFGQKTVLPLAAMRTGEITHGVALVGNRYLLATCFPITYDHAIVGAVMVGDPIDERMAYESGLLVGADVVYQVNGKVVASRLPAGLVEKVASDPRSVEDRVTVSYTLREGNPHELRVIVTQDLRPTLAPYASARATLWLIGVLCTLVGIGVLSFMLRSFYAAFEALDQGVHEVINGNLDYQFPFDFKEDLARGLGQSLNIMSLVLQGRPLPEDVEAQEAGHVAWLSEVQVADERAPDWGEAQRPIVTLETDVDRALAKEPADVYYKRIYSEFVEARKSLGLSTEGITYPKFLERLVHLEQDLKKRHRCAMVRFRVATRDGAVVLEPVPIKKLST